MKLKGIVDVDHTNYKKLSMFLITADCTFKCCKEYGCDICQNSQLAHDPAFEIDKERICEQYLNNPLTEAIVIGGMEPFDATLDLVSFIDCFRRKYDCKDDIVIYTGYTESEIERGWRDTDNEVNNVRADAWKSIKSYENIIVKFGRFIPNDDSHFDEVLGVDLASHNQYAKIYNMEDLND